MTTPEPAEPPADEQPVLSHAQPHRSERPLALVRLYREDLVEAARIIADECGNVEIDFHDDRGTIGNAPEAFAKFAEAGGPERLQRLSITGRRGTTSLQLLIAPAEARVVVEEPDNAARGAAERLFSLCYWSRGEPWALMADSRRDFFRFAGATAVVGACGLAGIALLQRGIVAIGGLLFLPGTVLSSVAAWQLYRLFLAPPKPEIINAPRAQRPTWWQRHRKDVLLVLVSGTVGGVIGYFVNQIPPL